MLNLFLPTRYNDYFLLKKTFLIAYLTNSKARAVLLEAKGYERKILKTAFLDIEFASASLEMISSSLFKLFGHWKYDDLKVIISSKIVIFKSIITPFHDLEKIRMTVPFELEPVLPFSLAEASLDVVFRSEKNFKNSNKALVVVTKEDKINYFREIFKSFAKKINKISVDAVEIAAYDITHKNLENHILFYNSSDGITIFLFKEKGLLDLKYIDIKISNHDWLYNQSNISEVEQQSQLITQILTSFAANSEYLLEGIKFSVLGIDHGHELIKKLIDKFKFVFSEYLENKIKFENIIVKFDSEKEDLFFSDVNNQYLLISSLLLEESEYFNLAHEAIEERTKILTQQVIVSMLLTIVFFVIQIAWNVFLLFEKKAILKREEYKVIQTLKKEFDLSQKHLNSIDVAYKAAEKLVISLEEGLPNIATKNKFIFIDIFAKLSKDILNDINSLMIYEMKWQTENGLNPELLNISGEVKDFNALRILEEKLKKSNLFNLIPQQQDLRFNLNLVVLRGN